MWVMRQPQWVSKSFEISPVVRKSEQSTRQHAHAQERREGAPTTSKSLDEMKLCRSRKYKLGQPSKPPEFKCVPQITHRAITKNGDRMGSMFFIPTSDQSPASLKVCFPTIDPQDVGLKNKNKSKQKEQASSSLASHCWIQMLLNQFTQVTVQTNR